MECVELAPAFEPRHTSESGSKLHALHTLRETRPTLSSVCAICSASAENLRKKTTISDIVIQRAGPRSRKYGGALRTDAPSPPLLLRHYKNFIFLIDPRGPVMAR